LHRPFVITRQYPSVAGFSDGAPMKHLKILLDALTAIVKSNATFLAWFVTNLVALLLIYSAILALR